MSSIPLDLLQIAIRFAAEKHYGQFRDGESALPYIQHPMDVLTRVRHDGGITDEAILCAAILHDVLEECDCTSNELDLAFGERVRHLVDELTREEPKPEVVEKLTDDERYTIRNELLLDGIAKMSRDAQIVKLADRASNLHEARRTRRGKKLKRYVHQSYEILKLIPEATNPALWKCVKRIADEIKEEM